MGRHFLEHEIKNTSELAYLTGVYLSDGWLKKDKRQLSYTRYQGMGVKAADLDFIHEVVRAFIVVHEKPFSGRIKQTVAKKHKIGNRIITPRKTHYQVDLFDSSLGRYLYKEEFDAVISEYPGSFLRGLFDGDGSISIYNREGRHVGLYFINTNYRTLDMATKCLTQLGIGSRLKPRHDNSKCVHLVVGNYYLLRFKEDVGFSIKRKSDKLTKAIELQGIHNNHGGRRIFLPKDQLVLFGRHLSEIP